MKHSTFARARIGALLFAGAMGFAAQAHALTLSPGMETWHTTLLDNLSQTQVETIVGASTGTLGLVYKQDQGGLESGNAMGYYTTAFSYESAGDASGATISLDGPMKISCPACYLVVKDGNHDATNPPPWPQYIFDIGGWNGTDTITLSGFWPGAGSISNIAIWNLAEAGGGGGGTITPVPEADTYAMLLAGLGLVGFAARRKLGKTA